jgi:hypothetical protein
MDTLFMDWFEVEYPASSLAIVPGLYTAHAGGVHLHSKDAEGSKWYRYRMTGFPEGAVVALDTGNALALDVSEELDARNIVTATFPVMLSAKTSLAIFSEKEFVPLVEVATPGTRRLADSVAGAELVIVAHDSFLDPLAPFVVHKKGVGIETALAPVSAVYDQYNWGHKNPSAIRQFLKDVHARPSSALRYVLLAGQASQDAHVLPGSKSDSPPDLVPTPWYSSPSFPPYPNDNWYSLLGDDKTSRIAVGRIPAVTREELAAALEKTIAYENSGRAEWKSSALFVASQEPFFQSELERTRDAIRQHSADSEITEVYAEGDGKGPDYALKLEEQLGKGVGVFYFAGHGGSQVWCVGPNWPPTAETNMFDIDVVSRLNNQERYPVVLAATCYTASFAFRTKEDSMGMRLLQEPGRGAVAVISSSYRCHFHPAARFFHELIESLYRQDVRTLGDAYLGAQSANTGDDTRESMTILGDPSLLVAPSFADAPEDETVQSNAVEPAG